MIIRYEMIELKNCERRVRCSTPNKDVALRAFKNRQQKEPDAALYLHEVKTIAESEKAKNMRELIKAL